MSSANAAPDSYPAQIPRVFLAYLADLGVLGVKPELIGYPLFHAKNTKVRQENFMKMYRNYDGDKWRDNSNNETAFLIERAPSGSSRFAQVGQTPANAVTWVETIGHGTIFTAPARTMARKAGTRPIPTRRRSG